MAYSSSKKALHDTVKIWRTIAQFTDLIFERLESMCEYNHILIEVVKREAVRSLNMDEGIINFCPLCDYYECSQRCLLAESSFSESCEFGCTKRWSCMDFYEDILERDWTSARESARRFANELERIV